MSLADIVRSGVAIANKITADGELQQEVTLKRWKSQDSDGVPTYAADLKLNAIVSHDIKRLRQTDGNETVSTTQVFIMDTIPALSPIVSGREEPVDPRDLVVLPTGRSGPVLGVRGGLADSLTERPYAVQVLLG